MRGRKPKPSYLRVLDGRASHSHKHNAFEPQPIGDLLEPPEQLPARQQLIWREAISQVPPGMLKRIDMSVFRSWVAASDAFTRANLKSAEMDLVVKHEGKTMQNPYLLIANKQSLIIRQCAAELGFSPTSRPRVKSDVPSDSGNVFADLKEFDDG